MLFYRHSTDFLHTDEDLTDRPIILDWQLEYPFYQQHMRLDFHVTSEFTSKKQKNKSIFANILRKRYGGFVLLDLKKNKSYAIAIKDEIKTKRFLRGEALARN